MNDPGVTDLYRFHSADGVLLYVGISLSAVHRASEHRGDKRWWPEVARMDVERHPSRMAALAAERQAILGEKPRYNIVHNRPAKPKPAKKPPRPPRTERPTERALWNCECCARPARYIQAWTFDDGRVWNCVCGSHDLDPEGHRTYWFDVAKIASAAEHYDWERHLLEKRWMDARAWQSWDEMVTTCRSVLPPLSARVAPMERVRHYIDAAMLRQFNTLRDDEPSTSWGIVDWGKLRDAESTIKALRPLMFTVSA